MPAKKTKPPIRPKSNREVKISLGLVALALMGVVLFGDLLYMVKLWATPPQSILVQPVLTINGDTSPSGSFKCWDAVVSDSTIYFSDQPNNRIVLFNRDGKYLGSITNKDAGKPDFKELSCMTLTSNGDLYCMDTWNAMIRGFNNHRQPLAQIDLNNKGFFGARGVAYSNGHFLVADTGTKRIAKVSPQGEILASWGRGGSGKGEYDNPMQVIADDQDRCYVNDKDNHRIQCIDANGKFLWDISVYWPPVAEALDNTHHLLYVSTGQAVNVYDLTGKMKGVLSVNPKSNDTFSNVNALSVFPDGDILVCHGNSATIFHVVPSATPASPAGK